MESHIITLSSIACTDLYPENTPSAFTNKLEKVIKLDPNINYEVALVNIYHPKEFYGIVGNDGSSGILLSFDITGIITNNNGVVSETEIRSYPMAEIKLEDNILSGDMSYIVAYVNKLITEEIQKTITPRHDYIHEKGCVDFHHKSQRVHLNYKLKKQVTNEEVKGGDIAAIKIQFRGRISDILGFDDDVEYQIYGPNELTPGVREGEKILAPFPPAVASGIDFLMVYSDIVERTYFGGNKVNILDILNFEGGSKGYHNMVYFPVSTKTIDEVSIRLTDQRGRQIHFKDTSNTICVLRIKGNGPV